MSLPPGVTQDALDDAVEERGEWCDVCERERPADSVREERIRGRVWMVCGPCAQQMPGGEW